MDLNFEVYKKKVYGCFTGKCVGGTLGMPFEGKKNVNPITYYDPVPTEMLPNDDLDLQVVNLETLLRTGLPVSRHHIGEIWRHHLEDSAPDEYSVAVANHQLGLRGPLSGQYRNKFHSGMGGAIRSELWACLAPANPALAALLAREDACTDHTGDGIYAEMFLAAVESAAFVEDDLEKLVQTGLSFVDEKSKLYSVFSDVLRLYKETNDVLAVRSYILDTYPSDNFTDVTINISFVLLALIASDGSFDKAICTAVSLGYDADCTGATVGSIFGIMKPDDIDTKWTKPIGDNLVLSPCIVNMHNGNTIRQFCDTIMATALHVQDYYRTGIQITAPDSLPEVKLADSWTDDFESLYAWNVGDRESLLTGLPCLVSLVYPEEVAGEPGKSKVYGLKLRADKAMSGTVQLYVPEKWQVHPSVLSFDLVPGESKLLSFSATPDAIQGLRGQKNLLTMRFCINGISFVLEAGLPISCPWLVTDAAGNESVYEATSIYFPVPEGAYRYKTRVNATAQKNVRIACAGTRPFILFINGENVFSGDGSSYVPAFHRGYSATTVSLRNGPDNIIELVLPEHAAGEMFFGFSTTFGCATWLDTIERTL
ncbi:MAG: ADP-ribosylglycohydrolase family protein [Clostridia bacterium]|nr:ADP-ribosylglycohydrolase family protein [Clostridia bacterium]